MKAYLGLLAAIPFFLLGCETTAPKPTGCEGQTPNPVNIHFDDSKLFVTPPKKEARRGKYLRFNTINPNSMDGYDVTIKSSAAWLNATGDKSSGSIPIVICVPDDAPLGEVKYEVEVANIGLLDPRVDVIP